MIRMKNTAYNITGVILYGLGGAIIGFVYSGVTMAILGIPIGAAVGYLFAVAIDPKPSKRKPPKSK